MLLIIFVIIGITSLGNSIKLTLLSILSLPKDLFNAIIPWINPLKIFETPKCNIVNCKLCDEKNEKICKKCQEDYYTLSQDK